MDLEGDFLHLASAGYGRFPVASPLACWGILGNVVVFFKHADAWIPIGRRIAMAFSSRKVIDFNAMGGWVYEVSVLVFPRDFNGYAVSLKYGHIIHLLIISISPVGCLTSSVPEGDIADISTSG